MGQTLKCLTDVGQRNFFLSILLSGKLVVDTLMVEGSRAMVDVSLQKQMLANSHRQ